MSFPDPPQLPHPFVPSTYTGAYWPPFNVENEQPDLMSQLDHPPTFKRPRNYENKPINPKMNTQNLVGNNGNNGTSSIFYKTRICARFMDGACRNGYRCSFAHGAEDLRNPPPNWQELVREKDRGSGSNFHDDQGMNDRMNICKKYYNGEECPYGENCIFLHERAPHLKLNGDVFGDPGRDRESHVIRVGTNGDFDQFNSNIHGKNNLDKMVFWKTKLCSKWEMGQCPFGERCNYAHGQSDLKSTGTRSEIEPVKNTGSILANTFSKSLFSAAPAKPTIVAAPPVNEYGEDKKSKWKLTKKLNRIYADWLDDLSPPIGSPSKEDILIV